jgi:hypothetical protein
MQSGDSSPHDLEAGSSWTTRSDPDDGRTWAREVKDAWLPCYLCLDGGGVRSYSSLLILKSLMHEVWMWENRLADEEEDLDDATGPVVGEKKVVPSENELLPCHYFDFFVGTSSGGIIATLLGRLRMTVDEATEAYLTITHAMFGHPTWNVVYDHTPMESCIRAIVAARCTIHTNCTGDDEFREGMPHGRNRESSFAVDEPRQAQTACLSALCDTINSEAFPLRTYPLFYSGDGSNWIMRYEEGPSSLTITQVLRATTATPMYFRPLKAFQFNRLKTLCDGGLRQNNPSPFALSELRSLYELSINPALFLSIGSGKPEVFPSRIKRYLSRILYLSGSYATAIRFFLFFTQLPTFVQILAWLLMRPLKALADVMMQDFRHKGEIQHGEMREHARGEHTWYKRLNVRSGLGDSAGPSMDKWQDGHFGAGHTSGGATLRKIYDATMQYVNREYEATIDSYAAPGDVIRQAAEKLVRHRRAREAGGGRRYDVFVGREAGPA